MAMSSIAHKQFIIAKIPSKNMIYSLSMGCQQANLYLEQDENAYKIYKMGSGSNNCHFYSLIGKTMYGGEDWKQVLKWYFKKGIDKIIMTNKIDEIRDVIFLTIFSKKMVYNGSNLNINEEEIQSWNIQDVKKMIKKYFQDLKKHLLIDFVNAATLYYRINHYLPSQGIKIKDPNSFFLFSDDLHVDRFDLLPQCEEDIFLQELDDDYDDDVC